MCIRDSLQESWILHSQETVHERNLQRLRLLSETLATEHPSKFVQDGGRPFNQTWRDVPASLVRDFLSEFEVHPNRSGTFANVRAYLDRVEKRFPQWDIAFVSLLNTRNNLPTTDINGWHMVHQERSAGIVTDKALKIPDSGDGYFVTNNQRVGSQSDEVSGLSDTEIEQAEKLAKVRRKNHKKDTPTSLDFRNVSVRGRPLLMLHLVELTDPTNGGEILLPGAPAIGVSFPVTGEYATVEYVLNQVMIDELNAEILDYPDDEEDFDHEDTEVQDGDQS